MVTAGLTFAMPTPRWKMRMWSAMLGSVLRRSDRSWLLFQNARSILSSISCQFTYGRPKGFPVVTLPDDDTGHALI